MDLPPPAGPGVAAIDNGLALPALRASRSASGAAAPSAVRVANRWVDGGHSRSRLGGHEPGRDPHPTTHPADLPGALGGTGRGPSPVELLLHALCACVTASVVLAATDDEVDLFLVETDASATFDHRPALGVATTPALGPVQVTVRVGAELDRAELDALLAEAWRRSPVVAALARSTDLQPAIEGVP